MYVAIIDDEVDLVYLFRDALSQISGVKVFSFTDPHLALEHFQTNHDNYKVVVSDYRMPEMTGIQLLEKMKEIDPTVTRMLVSAFEIEDKLFEECNCVDKFLSKPVSMVNLINEVKNIVHITPVPATNPLS